jgi:hypothetical protein
MTLGINMRGFRALTAVLACAGLALSPAVGDAAAKPKPKHGAKKATTTLREAKNKKPAATVKTVAKSQTTGADGLGNKVGLGAPTQLTAMTTGLKAAPEYFTGRSTGCPSVTPMLATQPGPIMAGNFRDADGACYVWLNLEQSSLLTGSEICKITLHEYGHLTGLQHTADPSDIMFAPFQADPIPAPCQPQGTGAKAAAVPASVCPPGALNADYCQAMPTPEKKATSKKKRSTRAAKGRM